MKLVEINWTPSDRQLRQFAWLCLFALPLLVWLWGGGMPVIGLSAGIGAIIAIAGMVRPQLIKPVFVALTVAAIPIGWVVGEAAMLLIYFGLFLPIGLVFRMMKRDALQRQIERDSASYWQAKRQPRSVGSYYRQS